MKTFAIIALIGAVQSLRFIDNYDDIVNDYDTSGVNMHAMMQVKGIPMDSLQPTDHWRKAWP